MRRYRRFLFAFVFFMFVFVPTASALDINKIHPAFGAVIRFGENVYVQAGETVKSDIISLGGDVYVNGKVQGSIIAFGGNVYINGIVNQDVTTFGGKLTIGPQGKINGKHSEIVRGFGTGPKAVYSSEFRSNLNTGLKRVFGFVIYTVLCLIIYTIMSKNTIKMAVSVEKNLGKRFLYGYGTIFGSLVLMVALVLTIIGILLIPILMLVLLIMYLIGFTAIMLYIGKKLTVSLHRKVSETWCIVIGVALYEILLSVTFLGIAFIINSFIVIPLSLGVVVSTRFGTLKPWRKSQETEPQWNWDNYKED